MKAAVIHRFGGPEEIDLIDLPTPLPGADQVLIKVLATAVTRIDRDVRQGQDPAMVRFPHVLGVVAVGEVAECGRRSRRFRIGERVMLLPERLLTGSPSHALDKAPCSAGTYAQYVVASESALLADSSGLPPEQAVTLPLPLLTAARAVAGAGAVKAGDRVLVTAGGSNTGIMCIQVARALGARVIATVRSGASARTARTAGAERVLQATDDVREAIAAWSRGQGVDVAIDLVGGEAFARTLKALKAGGILVSVGNLAGSQARLNIADLAFQQRQIRSIALTEVDVLIPWLERVRNGEVQPIVDRVLPLSEAARAHRLVADNRVQGSVVLLPWSH